MYSSTVKLIFRLLKILSKERKKSLYQIIPLAIITGIFDVLVVGLVSRLFVILVGKENRPSLPFSNFFTDDPFVKLIILISIYISFNWTPIENNFYWIGLVAMGIFGFISHFIIIYAIQLSNLSFVTNFQYSQLLWSTIINFLIFGVPADISKIIGLIGIIIFGVMFIRVEGSKKVKKVS